MGGEEKRGPEERKSGFFFTNLCFNFLTKKKGRAQPIVGQWNRAPNETFFFLFIASLNGLVMVKPSTLTLGETMSSG